MRRPWPQTMDHSYRRFSFKIFCLKVSSGFWKLLCRFAITFHSLFLNLSQCYRSCSFQRWNTSETSGLKLLPYWWWSERLDPPLTEFWTMQRKRRGSKWKQRWLPMWRWRALMLTEKMIFRWNLLQSHEKKFKLTSAIIALTSKSKYDEILNVWFTMSKLWRVTGMFKIGILSNTSSPAPAGVWKSSASPFNEQICNKKNIKNILLWFTNVFYNLKCRTEHNESSVAVGKRAEIAHHLEPLIMTVHEVDEKGKHRLRIVTLFEIWKSRKHFDLFCKIAEKLK